VPSVAPLGDAALLIGLGARVSREVVAHVHAAVEALRGAGIDGVEEIVPAYASLAVYFDPARTSYAALEGAIVPLLATASDRSSTASSRTIEIPTQYDGEDLADVAHATGLSVAEVTERHAARTYSVYALGFAPGFAYLGELDPALVVPRRATPRTRVPAGSVAIAGAQTAVYPLATPGGWHLIGRTSLVMFDARRDPPALLAVGDTVRFVPIDE
jgi:KipI family sensor histidine kinase inhibitor